MQPGLGTAINGFISRFILGHHGLGGILRDGMVADGRAGRRRSRSSRSVHELHTLKEVLVNLLSLFSGNKHGGSLKLL